MNISGTNRARGETLFYSVAILLGMSLLQRAVGFGRSVAFCRWLDERDLGVWDLAQGFLMLAAPIVVLGVPGSFTRYVETFRRQGAAQQFIRRAATIAAVVLALVSTAMICARKQAAEIVFNDATRGAAVVALAVCLATVVAFHFLVEAFAGMRRFRAVAALQFLNSLGFAIFGVFFLFTRGDGEGVIWAYAAAAGISSLLAVYWLAAEWSGLAEGGSHEPRGPSLWARVVPFAAWMWMTNLVSNLFDIADRWMLVHFGPTAGAAALADVGQYHSSRVIPLLLVNLANVVCQVVTPHLSYDWETGRRRAAGAQLTTILKLQALAMTAIAAVSMGAAPLIFDAAFGGKYAAGESVFAWTLACSVWGGLALTAANYAWLAERASAATAAMAIGLAANLGLNAVLIPQLGLAGAVVGTTAANMLVLAATLAAGAMLGWRLDLGTCLFALAPLALLIGVWTTAAVLLAAVALAWRTELIFATRDKRRCSAWATAMMHKYLPLRRAPAAS